MPYYYCSLPSEPRPFNGERDAKLGTHHTTLQIQQKDLSDPRLYSQIKGTNKSKIKKRPEIAGSLSPSITLYFSAYQTQ